MKTILLLLLILGTLAADRLDTIANNKIKAVYPMSNKEIQKYIPLIPRMPTEQEQEKARKLELKKQAKIKNNFTKESKIKNVKSVKVDIKTDNTDEDFFNTLSKENSAPVNME